MQRDAFKILPCATPGIHAVFARTRHSFDRHSHEHFGIGVVIGGAQRWHSRRGQVEAGAGATISCNAGEVHDGFPIGDTPRSWWMLYFDPDILLAAAEEVFQRPAGSFELPRPVMNDPLVASAFLKLLRAETRNMEPLGREELLLFLTARAGAFRPGEREGPPAAIAAAKGRLDDDPASPATLSELARIAGLSRFQLLRGFARATGLTPHAYLVQRRIDFVRRLIMGGTSLAQAAAAAGFADQSHMTRVFVRKYGLPPGAYARALA